MSSVIGIVLALMSAAVAALIKFDKRTFYATLLIVSASYYVLFAVMAGSMRAAMLESLIMTGFLLLAGVGFRKNPWLIPLALCAHGLLDLAHGRVLTNPGVPLWWPSFCMAYDIAVAGVLALLIHRSSAASRTGMGAPHGRHDLSKQLSS